MKQQLLFALLAGAALLAPCAQAETWYRWIDAQGVPHVTPQPPPLGKQYDFVQVPDPVQWRNAPDMPGEAGEDARPSAQHLFKSASQSVYRIYGRSRTSVLASGDLLMYGSAVAIADRLALTNCHVVEAAGDEVYLGAGGPESAVKAEIAAMNAVSDRCVVSVRDLQLHPVVGVRRFDTLEIGEAVYAIGNPGRLERTLSDGLISGKRLIEDLRYLQTTAPISPGSSGGGLFDARGNLVGVTTMTLKGMQNVNFAIPAEDFWK